MEEAINIWNNFYTVLEEKGEERALFYLLMTLHNELSNTVKCNNFIKLSKRYNLNSDIIVHTINALKSIKEELPYWEDFISYSRDLLIKELGLEKGKFLLKKIV